jgi:hypothetical protein
MPRCMPLNVRRLVEDDRPNLIDSIREHETSSRDSTERKELRLERDLGILTIPTRIQIRVKAP